MLPGPEFRSEKALCPSSSAIIAPRLLCAWTGRLTLVEACYGSLELLKPLVDVSLVHALAAVYQRHLAVYVRGVQIFD